jgi:hypothetical protein
MVSLVDISTKIDFFVFHVDYSTTLPMKRMVFLNKILLDRMDFFLNFCINMKGKKFIKGVGTSLLKIWNYLTWYLYFNDEVRMQIN